MAKQRPKAAEICLAFGLGTPLREPVAVREGLRNRLWKLTTTEGSFMIKQLNPSIRFGCAFSLASAHYLNDG